MLAAVNQRVYFALMRLSFDNDEWVAGRGLGSTLTGRKLRRINLRHIVNTTAQRSFVGAVRQNATVFGACRSFFVVLIWGPKRACPENDKWGECARRQTQLCRPIKYIFMEVRCTRFAAIYVPFRNPVCWKVVKVTGGSTPIACCLQFEPALCLSIPASFVRVGKLLFSVDRPPKLYTLRYSSTVMDLL